jgi:hypothetical protein
MRCEGAAELLGGIGCEGEVSCTEIFKECTVSECIKTMTDRSGTGFAEHPHPASTECHELACRFCGILFRLEAAPV